MAIECYYESCHKAKWNIKLKDPGVVHQVCPSCALEIMNVNGVENIVNITLMGQSEPISIGEAKECCLSYMAEMW